MNRAAIAREVACQWPYEPGDAPRCSFGSTVQRQLPDWYPLAFCGVDSGAAVIDHNVEGDGFCGDHCVQLITGRRDLRAFLVAVYRALLEEIAHKTSAGRRRDACYMWQLIVTEDHRLASKVGVMRRRDLLDPANNGVWQDHLQTKYIDCVDLCMVLFRHNIMPVFTFHNGRPTPEEVALVRDRFPDLDLDAVTPQPGYLGVLNPMADTYVTAARWMYPDSTIDTLDDVLAHIEHYCIVVCDNNVPPHWRLLMQRPAGAGEFTALWDRLPPVLDYLVHKLCDDGLR